MAHVFTLTDGTTTISLVASDVALENYDLKVPQDDDKTVVDTVDILISGTTGALMQTKARAIESMIEAARRYQKTRTGARVFVTAQLISDTDAWRSEIIGGRMELAEDALAVWGNYKMRATLYLERVPYWEGPQAGIPLANGNGTWDGSAATGLAIYNCNDGSGSSPNKRNNYVQIAANDVVGTLPAPVKVEFKQNLAGTMLLSGLYMATNADSAPTTLVHMIEAEDRAWGGTVTADAACSGGSKNVFSAYTGSAQAYWNLDSAIIQKTAGRWFRLLLAVRSRNATAAQMETIQADLRDSTGVNVLFRGPETPLNAANTSGDPIVDLGAFPLPPGSSAAAYDRVQLWITLRLASGSATTALDFIQMTPADNYRPVKIVPIGILSGDVLVDDGIDGASYATASGYRGPFLRTFTDPLVVWPGKVQRIYVLTDCDTMDYSITDKLLVRMWYRPRRLTI